MYHDLAPTARQAHVFLVDSCHANDTRRRREIVVAGEITKLFLLQLFKRIFAKHGAIIGNFLLSLLLLPLLLAALLLLMLFGLPTGMQCRVFVLQGFLSHPTIADGLAGIVYIKPYHLDK